MTNNEIDTLKGIISKIESLSSELNEMRLLLDAIISNNQTSFQEHNGNYTEMKNQKGHKAKLVKYYYAINPNSSAIKSINRNNSYMFASLVNNPFSSIQLLRSRMIEEGYKPKDYKIVHCIEIIEEDAISPLFGLGFNSAEALLDLEDLVEKTMNMSLKKYLRKLNNKL